MKTNFNAVLVLFAAAAFVAEAKTATSDSYLDAGVGIVDITPTEPVLLAGSPTQVEVNVSWVLDCMSKALVLSTGGQKVAIVTLDTLKYPVEHVMRARQQIEKATVHSGQQRHHLCVPYASRPAVALLQGPIGDAHCRGSGAGGARSRTCKVGIAKGKARGREPVPQGH